MPPRLPRLLVAGGTLKPPAVLRYPNSKDAQLATKDPVMPHIALRVSAGYPLPQPDAACSRPVTLDWIESRSRGKDERSAAGAASR
jgi:hypothetical protein